MSQPNVDAPMESFEAAVPEAAVDNTPNYSKQSLNIYTVLLLISFVCLIGAIVVLGYNLSQWEGLPFPYKTNTMAAPSFLTTPWLN